VMTVKRASSTIRLSDGSELAIGSSAHVAVSQKGATAKGGVVTRKKRLINIHMGKVDWHIAKSKVVPTVFVTPVGELRVLGTSGSFKVRNVLKKDIVVTRVKDGKAVAEIKFKGKKYAGTTLIGGQKLEVMREGDKAIIVVPEGLIPVALVLPDGTIVKVEAGEAVALSYLDNNDIRLEVIKGIVEVTRPGRRPQLLGAGEAQDLGSPGSATLITARQPGHPPYWPPKRRRPVSPDRVGAHLGPVYPSDKPSWDDPRFYP